MVVAEKSEIEIVRKRMVDDVAVAVAVDTPSDWWVFDVRI